MLKASYWDGDDKEPFDNWPIFVSVVVPSTTVYRLLSTVLVSAVIYCPNDHLHLLTDCQNVIVSPSQQRLEHVGTQQLVVEHKTHNMMEHNTVEYSMVEHNIWL